MISPTIRELPNHYKLSFVLLFVAELIGGIVLCVINYARYIVLITVITAVLSYKIVSLYREYNATIKRYIDSIMILNSLIFIFITIYYILSPKLDFLLYAIIEICLLSDIFIQVMINHITILCSIRQLESVEGQPQV